MSEFRVIALMAAYNEADIIGWSIGDLTRQGCDVHLIEDGSTDATRAVAAKFLGRGLLEIEDGRHPGEEKRFRYTRLLQRKAELASSLDADWFINVDADEFRESPWDGVPLRDAIARVDAAGFNAIDFELFDFQPTGSEYPPGSDPREVMQHYQPAREFDRLQIRAWKKTTHMPDLLSSGGHQTDFPGRRVFPVRFLLRHYPIRGESHGRRKLWQERLPLFDPGERDRGWHRQYDNVACDASFVRDPATLRKYDAGAARVLALLGHDPAPADADRAEQLSRSREEINRLSKALDERNHEAERLHRDLDAANREVERLGHALDASLREGQRLGPLLDSSQREAERLHRELHARNLETRELHLQLDARNRELLVSAGELERLRVAAGDTGKA